MHEHTFQKRIRYGETDQMGYLYYGNYCLLYEIGRAESIRSLGISYHELESKHRIIMPVIEVQSRYKLPLKYDELITIKTRIVQFPTKLITFYHEIYNTNAKLAHKGMVKLFFVDLNSNKRISAPHYLCDKLRPYFEQIER